MVMLDEVITDVKTEAINKVADVIAVARDYTGHKVNRTVDRLTTAQDVVSIN